MKKTRELIEKSLILIKEINTATNEQAKGIEQINTAVMEINKSTQEVAASSEESASASEELSAQAEELLNQVSQLMMLVEGTASQYGVNTISSSKETNKLRKHEIPKVDRRKQKPTGALPHKGAGEGGTLVKPEEVIPLDEDELKDF